MCAFDDIAIIHSHISAPYKGIGYCIVFLRLHMTLPLIKYDIWIDNSIMWHYIFHDMVSSCHNFRI